MTLAWETVHQEFEFDGSWRDIYVLDTANSDWQRLLEWLGHSQYQIVFRVNGEPAKLPSSVSEVFDTPNDAARLLSVDFGGVTANCHFFWEREIEFDIDPREVKSQAELDSVFGFMSQLADAIGKEAVLTPENCSEFVIFRVRPGVPEVEWQEFRGWHVR